MNHIIETASNGEKYALVIGSPIWNDRIDRFRIAHLILKLNLKTTIKNLDGEFLLVLYNSHKNELMIATDRFCSYTAFWAQNGSKFAASYNYSDLVRHCVNWPGFSFALKRPMNILFYNALWGRIPTIR